jgi:hypothetical protein
MAVSIETKPAFAPGTPHLLSEGNYFVTGHYYDVMPGAKQFLFIKETEQPHASTEIHVVLNWLDELKRLNGRKAMMQADLRVRELASALAVGSLLLAACSVLTSYPPEGPDLL